MSEELLNVLKRCTPVEARKQLNVSARDLDAQVLHLTTSLNNDGPIDSPERQAIVAYVEARIDEAFGEPGGGAPSLNLTPEVEGLRQWVGCHYRLLQRQYLTPEVLEWARSTFNEEEFLAGLREIQTTGGVDIKDLLDELEQEVTPRE